MRARKGGYEKRPNQLFSSANLESPYDTIRPDDASTVLGKLRRHIRKEASVSDASLSEGFITSSSRIADQIYLRVDPKYRFFWDIKSGRTIQPGITAREARIRDCLLPFQAHNLQQGDLEEERYILDLEDVVGRASQVLLANGVEDRVVTEIGSTKLDFRDCDLVFSRLEPYLGKIVINDPAKRYIGTTEWIPLKLRQDIILPHYLKYLLLMPGFLDQRRRGTFWLLRSGKRHARINEWDFGRIVIPLPDIITQQVVVQTLLETEQEIGNRQRHLIELRSTMDDAITSSLGTPVLEGQQMMAGCITPL